jgi:hypothetical protein
MIYQLHSEVTITVTVTCLDPVPLTLTLSVKSNLNFQGPTHFALSCPDWSIRRLAPSRESTDHQEVYTCIS